MTWWQVLAGVSTPVLVFAGAYVTAYLARRSGQEATRSADWSAFLREQREWTEDRLAERDSRIDGLEEDVRELRQELDDLLRKYRAAIAYIRRIITQLQNHVDREDIEPPPSNIEPDLPGL